MMLPITVNVKRNDSMGILTGDIETIDISIISPIFKHICNLPGYCQHPGTLNLWR
jgi:hypothetical protein